MKLYNIILKKTNRSGDISTCIAGYTAFINQFAIRKSKPYEFKLFYQLSIK